MKCQPCVKILFSYLSYFYTVLILFRYYRDVIVTMPLVIDRLCMFTQIHILMIATNDMEPKQTFLSAVTDYIRYYTLDVLYIRVSDASSDC